MQILERLGWQRVSITRLVWNSANNHPKTWSKLKRLSWNYALFGSVALNCFSVFSQIRYWIYCQFDSFYNFTITFWKENVFWSIRQSHPIPIFRSYQIKTSQYQIKTSKENYLHQILKKVLNRLNLILGGGGVKNYHVLGGDGLHSPPQGKTE